MFSFRIPNKPVLQHSSLLWKYNFSGHFFFGSLLTVFTSLNVSEYRMMVGYSGVPRPTLWGGGESIVILYFTSIHKNSLEPCHFDKNLRVVKLIDQYVEYLCVCNFSHWIRICFWFYSMSWFWPILEHFLLFCMLYISLGSSYNQKWLADSCPVISKTPKPGLNLKNFVIKKLKHA